jgi:acetyltransferase
MDTVANTRRRKEKLYLGYAGRRIASSDPVAATPPPEGEIFFTHDGVRLVLREIHADDFEALQRGFAGLTAQEVRYRFLHPITELPEALARSLSNIDREHSVAIVLIDPPETKEPEIHAVARAYVDAVTLSAEFALVVQHQLAGHGVGTLLMQRLTAACRALGATELWGDVLAENGAMLELCEHLGFSRHPAFEDPGVIRVRLSL